MKGQVITGEFGKILIRQKSDQEIELGELLVAEHEGTKILMQVYDLQYGSQISKTNLELMSGLMLEEQNDLRIMDEHLRNYNLALAKNILTLRDRDITVAKTLPKFLSTVREVNKDDILFLTMPNNPLYLGKLRSGTKQIDIDINLEGDKVLSEHILIPATTGRGKSNLTSCLLWDLMQKSYSAALVLDPHDEYYGRNGLGLKDHPEEKPMYYSPNPPAGQSTLKINISNIKPEHFNGTLNWSDPQKEAMIAYYRMFGEDWIANILTKNIDGFFEATLNVVRRRFMSLLSVRIKAEQMSFEGIFDKNAGAAIISDICTALENAKTVIIDTSNFSGATEILVGSIITTEILKRYKYNKKKGIEKPVVSIVLEEAPRVLGKDVLEKGSNIFATIAREGRKFKVGLIAVTQLPSLIPRQILANMNTKIILGIEMAPERLAVIESASQDLSDDARNIASLDKGEAIITSNFARFALPVKIPLFKTLVHNTQNAVNKEKYISRNYNGVQDGTAKTS